MLRRQRLNLPTRPNPAPCFCFLALTFLAVSPLSAAFLPDQIGDALKKESTAISPPDSALWEEYGFDEAERAAYVGPGKRFSLTAWRMDSSTGGLAAYQQLRPESGKPLDLTPRSVGTTTGALVQFGNYVFQFDGYVPKTPEMAILVRMLPRIEQSPLPAFFEYVNKPGLIPASVRYIGGPVALEKFAPAISPSQAAFRYGSEAQFARYNLESGPLSLVLFSYPTPHIARERAQVMQSIGNTMVKRTGPLLAVALNPANADEAERLLSLVNYEATISWSERIPTSADNPGVLLIGIFTLVGVLLLGAIAAGMGFGGLRIVYAKLRGQKVGDDDLIRLQIDQ